MKCSFGLHNKKKGNFYYSHSFIVMYTHTSVVLVGAIRKKEKGKFMLYT